MSLRPFTFTVTVEVERETGKFMSREDIEAELRDALEGADPGSVEGGPDGDSVYNVVLFEVEAR